VSEQFLKKLLQKSSDEVMVDRSNFALTFSSKALSDFDAQRLI
jgi:transcriptional regulator CtsR